MNTQVEEVEYNLITEMWMTTNEISSNIEISFSQFLVLSLYISFKSNARDTTYFTTIYLQTDMALMCQYTISAIKTPNSHVIFNLTKNLKILNSKTKPRSTPIWNWNPPPTPTHPSPINSSPHHLKPIRLSALTIFT